MTSRLPAEAPRADNTAIAALRDAVSKALSTGAMWPAVQAARQLLELEPAARTYAFLRRALENAPAETLGFTQFKIALLSSFSSEFVHDALAAHGFANGLKIEIHQAAFGTFRQELIDSDSALYRVSPQAVVLAVEANAWLPESMASSLRSDGDATALLDRFRDELAPLLEAFRSRSDAALLIHNFPLPVWPRMGMTDAGAPTGEAHVATGMSAVLADLSRSIPNTYVVDYAGLVSRFGALGWCDDRMRLYAGIAVRQPLIGHLAAEYVKFFRALSGGSKKCLVLDLDNTLWGGVIGEDGLGGIKLGPTYPGNAFVEFQRYVRGLRDRGVILAIASKNNLADVEDVFHKHQFMVLKPDDFAQTDISWEPKSRMLANIARRLNIGLEHMVFADDNPVEIEEVREALPMVTVVRLPSEPADYIAALAAPGWFDALTVSDEDRRRGDLYRQRDQAEALRSASHSMEQFYRDLDMELTFAQIDEQSLRRGAQLTQKTNQFNATTRRYTDADLRRMAADPKWTLRTVAVRDRFGDNGIVGLLMARQDGRILEIDTFLLSCRVIGRTVETAMLACLCDDAQKRRAERLLGRIIPTPKNAPIRDLFKRHGFHKSEEQAGEACWTLDLSAGRVAWPEWFRVTLKSEPREQQSHGA